METRTLPSKAAASCSVNLTTSQVETLLDVLEDIDLKLKTLGIVEINSKMIYAIYDY